MKIFAITGDRSAYPGSVIPIVLLTVARLLQEHGPIRLVTGGLNGVEQAVRAVADAVGIGVLDLQWLNKEWDDYGSALVDAGAEKILVIHGDPMVSNMYPGFMSIAGVAERVELVQPDALYVG